MSLELNPRHKQRISDLAQETGKSTAKIVEEILETALFPSRSGQKEPRTATASHDFHEARTDLDALILAQGVKSVSRFEDLLGDFWPENEDVDDFLKARMEWSLEGREALRAE